MLHPRLRSELPLVLSSLFIAFVIWLIAKQSDLETDWLTATVEVQNVPAYMTVDAEPARVSINVQYPKALSTRIEDKFFVLPIDAAEAFDIKPTQWENPTKAKIKTVTLRPNSVKSNSLPPSVQVVGIGQPALTLKAMLRMQEVGVKVETTGTLPANLIFTAPPQPEPSKVMVAGPPEALARLASNANKVATDPIDLSSLQGSGQVFPKIRLPDERLILLGILGRHDNRVTVNIGLTERPTRTTIPAVPINLLTFTANLKAQCMPPRADVVVEGPDSALKLISATDIVFTTTKDLLELPGRSYEVGLIARLRNTVSGTVAQQVRIVELRPPRISVEFVSVDKQNKGEGANPSFSR